jgi:hypothetical protein
MTGRQPLSAEHHGPTVVVCAGDRCRAVAHRTAVNAGQTDHPVNSTGASGSELLDALRAEVRNSADAVLIRSGCLGLCAHAPIVLIANRARPGARVAGGVALGPIEQPNEVQSLREWIRRGSTGETALPAPLRPLRLGTTTP